MNEELFTGSVPFDHPGESYAQVVLRFLPFFLLMLAVITLGLLGAAIFPWAALQFVCVVVAVLGGVIWFIIFRTFCLARDALTVMYNHWAENQEFIRNHRASELALNIRVSGKGNTVNYSQQPTQNNVLVMPDSTLVKHFEEFVHAVDMFAAREDGEGHERRHFLAADGAVRDFQFHDGGSITRPEYEQHVKLLDVRDRRQGKPGRRST